MLPQGLKTGHTAKLPGSVGDLKKQAATGTSRSQSGLEEGFWRLWTSLKPDLPVPIHDYQFAWPERKWEIDFFWWESKVAVEIDGGAPGGGRHQRRKGFSADAEKKREAEKRGYTVLCYPSDEWKERPAQIIEEIASIVTRKAQ